MHRFRAPRTEYVGEDGISRGRSLGPRNREGNQNDLLEGVLVLEYELGAEPVAQDVWEYHRSLGRHGA